MAAQLIDGKALAQQVRERLGVESAAADEMPTPRTKAARSSFPPTIGFVPSVSAPMLLFSALCLLPFLIIADLSRHIFSGD